MRARDPEKCFGCGLCISKCSTEAISLVLGKGEEHIPVEVGWPLMLPLPDHEALLKWLKDEGVRGAQSPM